jgi:hypothetical protein
MTLVGCRVGVDGLLRSLQANTLRIQRSDDVLKIPDASRQEINAVTIKVSPKINLVLIGQRYLAANSSFTLTPGIFADEARTASLELHSSAAICTASFCRLPSS